MHVVDSLTEPVRAQYIRGLILECLPPTVDPITETGRKVGGTILSVLFVKPCRYGFEICLLFFVERPSVIAKTPANSGDVRKDPVRNWRIRTNRQHHIISIDI